MMMIMKQKMKKGKMMGWMAESIKDKPTEANHAPKRQKLLSVVVEVGVT